ncbi:MAG TPA: hypothetical protein VGZ22_10975, partial [Isosphaeraceae bacterium]|nr:hypothetical protein [Isosphaeraceae bacterium]
ETRVIPFGFQRERHGRSRRRARPYHDLDHPALWSPDPKVNATGFLRLSPDRQSARTFEPGDRLIWRMASHAWHDSTNRMPS